MFTSGSDKDQRNPNSLLTLPDRNSESFFQGSHHLEECKSNVLELHSPPKCKKLKRISFRQLGLGVSVSLTGAKGTQQHSQDKKISFLRPTNFSKFWDKKVKSTTKMTLSTRQQKGANPSLCLFSCH